MLLLPVSPSVPSALPATTRTKRVTTSATSARLASTRLLGLSYARSALLGAPLWKDLVFAPHVPLVSTLVLVSVTAAIARLASTRWPVHLLVLLVSLESIRLTPGNLFVTSVQRVL